MPQCAFARSRIGYLLYLYVMPRRLARSPPCHNGIGYNKALAS